MCHLLGCLVKGIRTIVIFSQPRLPCILRTPCVCYLFSRGFISFMQMHGGLTSLFPFLSEGQSPEKGPCLPAFCRQFVELREAKYSIGRCAFIENVKTTQKLALFSN